MVQRLRTHLPMQGTGVPSLVQEDPTSCRATKPMYQAPEPEAHRPQSQCSTTRDATAMRGPCTATGEWTLPATTRRKPTHSDEDSAQPKIIINLNTQKIKLNFIKKSKPLVNVNHLRIKC